MCTYVTERIDMSGSGKGAEGWFPVTRASVYVDHPVHAPQAHTLNIDFINPDRGASARVAVELTEESGRSLIAAIESALESAPPGIASADAEPPAGH